MTKKHENLTYLILFFVTFTLLVYLEEDARHAYRGKDITANVGDILLADSSTEESRAQAQNLFSRRDLLYPLITPKPTPTKKIVPTPTPTLVPFAKLWKVKMILGDKLAAIIDETGKPQYLSPGDEHITGVMIVDINPKEKYVEVEYTRDGLGRRKKIYKDGPK